MFNTIMAVSKFDLRCAEAMTWNASSIRTKYLQCNLLGSWKKNKGVVTVHVVSKIVHNHKQLENSIQNLIIYATCILKS